MRLSPRFTLEELTKSQTGERLGIDNIPNNGQIENLRALCTHVLEPIREKFGPFTPSSGFRCDALNRAIGGAVDSQHRYGKAADIEVPVVDNLTLARWIGENLLFDQLILEYYVEGDPRSGWVHVSWDDHGGNRNEILTAVKGEGYHRGLPD